MSNPCADLEVTPDGARLVLRGSLGIADVAAVLGAARSAAGARLPVALDLSDAEHLHAACLQVLIALQKDVEAQGGAFRVSACSEPARRALRLCGLSAWNSEKSQ